jgi:hypothetical protein
MIRKLITEVSLWKVGRICVVVFLSLAAPRLSSSRADMPIVKADLCAIAKNPAKYAGRFVEVRGNVWFNFETFAIKDDNRCDGAIWLAYPYEKQIEPKPNFTLKRDSEFARFQSAIEKATVMDKRTVGDQVRDNPMTARLRDRVVVTITGRLDSADKTDQNGQIRHSLGFGNGNDFRAQLVIRSVSNVEVIPNPAKTP